MRIAIIHNRYRNRGGEESVVDFESELLEAHGHEVHRLEFDNDEVFHPPGPAAAKALWCAPSNPESYRRVRNFLRDTGCEVGHVHNWFPLMSPSVYAAHKDLGIPVVQTLHNFRMGCAAGTLLRDGKHCETCLDGDRAPAVRNGCYRDSRLLSWLWRRTVERNWRNGTFQKDVALYLCPTEFVALRHERLGIPRERLRVVSHGVPDPGFVDAPMPSIEESGAVFVGRLSREKGIDVLLEAWKELPIRLTIVGDGPESGRVKGAMATNDRIEWRGLLNPEDVAKEIRRHAALISPHRGPETFGLSIVEAMAAGRAVVASELGGPGETIVDGTTGLLTIPGDVESLVTAIRSAIEDPAKLRAMGAAGRKRYEQLYRPEAHLEALVDAYQSVLGLKQGRVAI